MNKKKVIFTGGHHTSALAVALVLKDKGHQVFWLGHKRTMKGDRHLSLEYKEVIGKRIPFYNLVTGKFHQSQSVGNFFRTVFGFIQSLVLLLKIRPDLVVCFGGYLAVPIVIMAWLLRIPSVIHEQTVVAGRANRLLAKFSQKVLISWSSSKKFFPKDKVVLTGLPLRPVFLKAKTKSFFSKKRPTIYITGGKQGAHVLNQAVKENLGALLSQFNLIHQTGYSQKTKDWQRLNQAKEKLSPEQKSFYFLQPFFSPKQAGQAFKTADFVVGRAGAHTVYELAILGKPAILIPLVFSSAQEQMKNAQKLVDVGLVEILLQKQLTKKTFLKTLVDFYGHLSEYQLNGKNAQKLVITNGLQRVVKEIEELWNEKEKGQ